MRDVSSLCFSVALGWCVPLLVGCPTAETPPGSTTKEPPSPEREALRTRCAKAIEHVTLGIYPETARPKEMEATVIMELGKKATAVCVEEGFEQKQADCMMSAKMGDGLASVRECLGDKTGWPSWFTGAGVQLP